MSELPNGWTVASLKEVANLLMGQSPPSNTYNTSQKGLPFFQGKTEFGALHPTVRKWCAEPVRVADVGSILISVRAPVGPTNVANMKCCIGRGLAAISGKQGVSTEYLLHFFRSIEPWLSRQGTGSTFTAINKDFLESLEVPLAPLKEQKRIVAKLDELLPKVEACKQRLEKIPTILKRFRQSVLADAVSGKLTEEWRNNHEYAENENLAFPVPASWTVTKTADLFSFVTSGSRGWAQYYSDSGAIFLRMGNLEHDDIRLDLSDIQYVSPPKGSEGSRTRVQLDDILISITADVGMIAHVDKEFGEAYINQHVALARPIKEKIVPRFLALYLTCLVGGRDQFKSLQRGATKVGLGLDDIKNIWVAVPSLEEQLEIVKRYDVVIEALNRRCDVSGVKRLVDRTCSAILESAFAGKLCNQDDTDEPAASLLERIKTQSAPKPKKSVPRKRKSEKEEQSLSA